MRMRYHTFRPRRRFRGVARWVPGALVLAAAVLLAWPPWATLAGTGHPAEEMGTADVTVLVPITVTEDAQLDFGKIIPPVTTATKFIMADDGSLSVTGEGYVVGGSQLGTFTVVGSNASPVSIHTNAGTTPTSTCTGPSSGSVSVDVQLLGVSKVDGTDGVSPITVTVKGDVQVQPGTADGTYTCSYVVSAFYVL